MEEDLNLRLICSYFCQNEVRLRKMKGGEIQIPSV